MRRFLRKVLRETNAAAPVSVFDLHSTLVSLSFRSKVLCLKAIPLSDFVRQLLRCLLPLLPLRNPDSHDNFSHFSLVIYSLSELEIKVSSLEAQT